MADDSPRSDDAEGVRSKGWNKLRGKIFDKEVKLSKFRRHHSNEQDVDDFLRPGAVSPSHATTHSGPRLDISAAKGQTGSPLGEHDFLESTSATVGGDGGIPSYAPTREDMAAGKWTPHKPTRRPGLRVEFLDGPADVIGEGGEESEETPLAVGRRCVRSQHSDRPNRFLSTGQTPPPVEPVINASVGRSTTSATHDPQQQTYRSGEPIRQHDGQPSSPRRSPHRRKPSSIPYPPPSVPTTSANTSHPDYDGEIIRPLRRAPTGMDEAREHQQNLNDASNELHLSPTSPPEPSYHQVTYEQQMQQILTNTYSASTQASARKRSPPLLRRSPARNLPSGDDIAPEIRSPVDSGSMRKMRAEEGLVHRSSVQGIQGIPGGDKSVTAALSQVSPALEAPSPYSAQPRSSFESNRSGDSEQSRYSHSPEPSSLPSFHRFSTASYESTQFLSPPASSHGHPPRPVPPQRPSVGPQEISPSRAYDKTLAQDTSLAHGTPQHTPALTETIARPQPLSVSRQRPDSKQLAVDRDPSAEEAYSQFASAVAGTGSIFQLAAEDAGVQLTLYDWTRCALWWFLKGQEGIQQHQGMPGTPPGHLLQQHHLNLAKAYWMLTEVIPPLLSNAEKEPKTCPPSQNLKSVDAACSSLDDAFKAFCVVMRKYELLPTQHEKAVQGVDSKLWLQERFDNLPLDWQWVLSGKVFAPTRQTTDVEPLSALPLQDTRSSYCYGRIFVSAKVTLEEDKPVIESLECALTFVRSKSSAEAEVVISSQDSNVNVHIRATGEQGVHWEHTRFDADERSLRVKLPQKLRLKLLCSQRDYDFLWGFHNNSQRISQSLLPKKNERLLQPIRLRSFHFRDTSHPDEFPSDPVGICRAALFEQLLKSNRDPRMVHAGHRLAIVNLERTVRNVNISFGKTAPFEYNLSDSQPTLQFQMNEAGRRRSAHMVFEELQQRDLFRDLLSGTVLGNNESMLRQIPIRSLALSRATASNLIPAIVNWDSLQIINEDDPTDPHHLSVSADASEHLRIMMYQQSGSIVDRMTNALVDLKIRLEPAVHEQLHIYRDGGRQDLTIAIGPDPSETKDLRQMFDFATSGPHVCTYTFGSLQDLHGFQGVVTGFAVKYDGVASSFSIPRRKPGSVIAKQLESSEARVQIVERDRVTQLIAFFDNYILADSMNFELRPTDKFEMTDGKTLGLGVKLVDAKFVLPGSGKDDPVKDGAVRDASAKYTAFDTENYNEERMLGILLLSGNHDTDVLL
ncbi:MAG: hypothetical protein Q9159_005190 [Coniocarpon cinnabarinum]